MAENKKGFILYADLLQTFTYLNLEQRGQVITWVLEYVNDLNPEPLEGLLMAVVEPIKQQLKRDLKKKWLKVATLVQFLLAISITKKIKQKCQTLK